MISTKTREEIKQDRQQGLSLREISGKRGISVATIHSICGKKYESPEYKHLQAQAQALRLSGKKLHEIATALGKSIPTVVRLCSDVKPKDARENESLKDSILHMYDSGCSMMKISRDMMLRYDLVRDIVLRNREIDQSRRGGKFDVERAKMFHDLRETGLTYEAIGEANDCSRQNVQQYVARYRDEFVPLEESSTP